MKFRKLLIKSFALGIMAVAAGFTVPAIAQVPLKVAVLDIKAIRMNSLAIKDIRAQIEKYRQGFQADIKKEEDALRIANQELAKKRTLLGPEAFANERRLFEQKVVGVQKLVSQRKIDLDGALTQAMLVVEKKMNVIMGNVATKRGASLVLRRQDTILADRSMDMTQEENTLNEMSSVVGSVGFPKPIKSHILRIVRRSILPSRSVS